MRGTVREHEGDVPRGTGCPSGGFAPAGCPDRRRRAGGGRARHRDHAGAGALPQPSIDSVQAKVNNLTTQFNKADQQYDKAAQQLTAAKARLRTVNKQLASEEAKYKSAQRKVQQIADSSYEDSAQTSLAGLLTSADPGQVLAEASIVLQLSDTQEPADPGLPGRRHRAQQRPAGAAAHRAGHRPARRADVAHQEPHPTLLDDQKTILDSLTAAQLAAVNTGTSNGGGGSTTAKYTGPTGTQADAAVAFVFKQLGCPYNYGATGPCSVGFDCSGLVMSAWASAGHDDPA